MVGKWRLWWEEEKRQNSEKDETDRLTELSIFEGPIPWMLTLRGKVVWVESRNYFKSQDGRMEGKEQRFPPRWKKRQGSHRSPPSVKRGLFLRSEMQKAISCWMEQAQMSRDWCRRTAEACGVVRKAKTQNELQLEQVTQKKEESFYDTFERRALMVKGSVGPRQWGGGGSPRQTSLRFL